MFWAHLGGWGAGQRKKAKSATSKESIRKHVTPRRRQKRQAPSIISHDYDPPTAFYLFQHPRTRRQSVKWCSQPKSIVESRTL